MGMRALVVSGIAALLTAGCGSGKTLGGGQVDTRITARNVIRNHVNGEPDFRTLSGRLAIDYSDGESDQSVTVTLRMKRDQIIWLSAPLGVVKVYITPDSVSYYNKLQDEYFEEDFRYIRELLGSEINFGQLQNLLLGQSIADLREGKFDLEFTENAYQLKPKEAQLLYTLLFQVEPAHFRMGMQQLAQPELRRLLEIRYTGYQEVSGRIFPEKVRIAATDDNGRISVSVDFRQLELNRDLNYPFRIPKGYNSIGSQ